MDTLTDDQYLTILLKIRKIVMDPKFIAYCYDSTMVGNKYNESNCGFCNDNFASKEEGTAGRKAVRSKYYLKERRKNQPCPFDLRPEYMFYKRYKKGKVKKIIKGKTDYGWSCFYNCFLFGKGKIFKKLGKKNNDMKYIRYRVNKTIRETRNRMERRHHAKHN